MNLLNRIEHKLNVPFLHITAYLISGQIVSFLLIRIHPEYGSFFTITGDQILSGQVWRILFFLFRPITTDLIWAAFTWYIYFLYSSTLEHFWGSFRYLVYLLISIVAVLIGALLFPTIAVSNTYLYGSIFLAFAFLFPHFKLMLFFVIPIEIRWFAYLVWLVSLGTIVFGPWEAKIFTLLSIVNFGLFFGKEVRQRIQDWQYHKSHQVKNQFIPLEKPRHTCSVCGKNEQTDPYMGIRYCGKCVPERCFCEADFISHTHIVN